MLIGNVSVRMVEMPDVREVRGSLAPWALGLFTGSQAGICIYMLKNSQRGQVF